MLIMLNSKYNLYGKATYFFPLYLTYLDIFDLYGSVTCMTGNIDTHTHTLYVYFGVIAPWWKIHQQPMLMTMHAKAGKERG